MAGRPCLVKQATPFDYLYTTWNMRHTTKQHPLKPINLSFQENRQPPAFEVEALRQYKKAHDETWKLKVQCQSRIGQLMLLQSEIDDLYFEKFSLEQQLEIFEEALGIGGPAVLPAFDQEIIMDLGGFFDNTVRHNKALQELHTQVVDASSRYNEAIANLYEDDFLIDPMYFDVLSQVYQRYEEVEVDTVSLDRDHQEFLEAYGEVHDLREEYMGVGQRVFDGYSRLHHESEDLYRRSEIVSDRIDEEMGG